MERYTAADLAAWREDLPGHWWIEVIVPGYAALVAVPATAENANRVLAGSPGVTPDMLDGLTVHSNRLKGEPHGQAAPPER